MFGFEGSHKSFIALDIAYCIAHGLDWQGHKVKPGRVMYVAAEGGPSLGDRVRAWHIHHGREVSDDVEWLMGEELMLDDEQDAWASIEEWQDKNLRLIIFDTLRTSSRGNEMSPETMNTITRSMRILVRELSTTVMVLHHPPKSSDDTYGGAGAMGSNLTTNIRVRYDGKERTTLRCFKQKDADFFQPLEFVHRAVGPSLIMQRSTPTGTESAEQIDTVSSGLNRDERTVQAVHDAGGAMPKAELVLAMAKLGISKSDAYRRINKLVARHKLVQDGRTVRIP